jgi:hypothetical protein
MGRRSKKAIVARAAGAASAAARRSIELRASLSITTIHNIGSLTQENDDVLGGDPSIQFSEEQHLLASARADPEQPDDDDESSLNESECSSEYWLDSVSDSIVCSPPRSGPSARTNRQRGPYTGGSRTTAWRRQSKINAMKRTHRDIRSYFAPSPPAASFSDSEAFDDEDVILPDDAVNRFAHGDVLPPSFASEEELFPEDLFDDDSDDEMAIDLDTSRRRGWATYVDQDLNDVANAIQHRRNLTGQGDYVDMLKAIQHYLRNVVTRRMSRKKASMLASTNILGRGEYAARQIRNRAFEFKRTGDISLSERGQHTKTNRVIDIDFVRRDIQAMLNERRRTSASSFHWWLNRYLVSSGFNKVSARTSRKWLTIDFMMRRHNRKKGVYYDGHDREDVQDYLHKVYIPALDALEARRVQYIGDLMDVQIAPEDKAQSRVHVAYQDESIFYSLDAEKYYYALDGDQELRQKGMGRSLHVSDFILEDCGFLDLEKVLSSERIDRLRNDGSWPVNPKSRVIIRPGKNADGWWDHEQLLVQIDHFLNLFEIAYPGDIACLVFDCSANHEAFAKDALIVSRMNVNPGGKQSLMRDTTFVDASQRHLPVEEQIQVHQTMVFPSNHPNFPSMAKGMVVVLQERGLLPATGDQRIKQCTECKKPVPDSNRSLRCCLHRMLSSEQDFQNEVSAIPKLVHRRGHMCLFLPKFHCELNPIECAWCDSKVTCRAGCDGSWAGLQNRVPASLDSIPIERIRRWFRLAERFRDAYKRGLTGRLADFATRKYRSHRRMPDNLVVAELQEEFDQKRQERIARHSAK